ncbi:MAG: NifU family protein [Alphaproteobacteria bacterium]
MFIQTEETPNPATLKFLPGRAVMAEGTREFVSQQDADGSPLAAALFRVDGVSGVFFGPDFITITKDGGDWAHLKPALLGAITDHYASGTPLFADGASTTATGHAAYDGDDEDVVAQIKELLDTRVRPAVAQDGGDILFHGFKDGVVYLHMRGACAGCPSSTMTLKMGIENMLRHYVPEVEEVQPVEA